MSDFWKLVQLSLNTPKVSWIKVLLRKLWDVMVSKVKICVCGWEKGYKGVILKCSLAAAGRFQWKRFKVYGGEASLTALELIGNKWVHMVSFKVRKGSRRFLQRGPYTCAWTTCCVKYVWGGVFLSQSHRYKAEVQGGRVHFRILWVCYLL